MEEPRQNTVHSVQFHLYEVLEKAYQWLPGNNSEGRELTKRQGGTYWRDENIVVVDTQLYTFVKTHQIIHLKWVKFTVCKL